MKVVILAGGYGTRLSEETAVLPKPMIEIGGRPLLWHLMKSFSVHGFNEFVVALGYKGDVIKRYFLQYPDVGSDLRIELGSGKMERQGSIREDWNIELVDTGQDTMTGGRLRRLRDRLGETFLFTYGDGLSTVDLPKPWKARDRDRGATSFKVRRAATRWKRGAQVQREARRCEHIYQRRLLRARAGSAGLHRG
jgi:glucose-1-phosphate cytidylyltransferase